MKRVLALMMMAPSLLVVDRLTEASAACGQPTTDTVVSSATNAITLGAQTSTAGCENGDAGPSSPGAVQVRDSDLDTICVRDAISADQDPFAACDLPTDPTVEAPQVTPGMVAAAFRRLPLPAAELQVQPPNGRTLVNFATNFYTERGDLTRSVTLLGRRVDLRITATGYTWHFGDGTTTTTTEPGAPYPALDVTHDYRRAGRVAPSVDTTYSAEFSVDGGPWRPVSGTVTIPGPPTALRVLTATPTLVGHR